jgi:hypothetical protein
MRRQRSLQQRGIALLAMLAILAVGASAYLIRQLNTESGGMDAVRKNRNAEVLNRAKQALIGYVAQQAALSGDPDPGAFPCPEAPGGYNSTSGTDGKQASSCTLPAVGRFPWRSIGLDKLVDSAGEPLWYVVANGWNSSSGNTVINSNCTDAASAMTCWTGQLTVDGQANAAVALIIAPGPAINTVVGTGCATAVNQSHPVVGPPNVANYLECDNATADSSYVTTGPSGSFNDQVIKITAAEVLPAIEAAIADRFQKEFAPTLRTTYSGAPWTGTATLPFAVAFSNPTIDPGRKLQGAAVVSTGTAAVTNGSATVTLSAVSATSLADRHFRVSGSTSAFRISAHTAGTAVLTLSPAFSGTTSGTASYQVFAAGGLLPATYAFNGQCTACATGSAPCTCTTPTACTVGSDPRCDPTFVAWSSGTVTQTGGASLHSSSGCVPSGSPTILTCTLNWSFNLVQLFGGNTWMTFDIDATAANAGLTWRKISGPPVAPSYAVAITGIDTSYINSPIGYNISSATMNTNGSATIKINGRITTAGGSILGVLSGITCTILGIFPACYSKTVTVPMALIGDQDIFYPGNNATNWFFRNKWHEVSYYAAAPNITPSGALHSCIDSSTCLQVTRHVNDGKHRGLLVIGGPKIATQARPALVPSDLLDGANTTGASPFELRSTTLGPNRAFNDHFAVIDKNP